MLLLVVGVLLAVGVPTTWALTHQDPALTPVGQGVAVALAQSGSGDPDQSAGSPPTAHTLPNAAESDTLGAVTTAPTATPTAVSPTATSRASARSTASAPKKPTTTKAAPRPVAPSTKKNTPKPSPLPTTSAAPAPAQPPVRLRIPAIGVDAPVGPVGIDDRGDMAIPEQVQDIGWYKFGPAPGADKGSAVLSGHVDSAQQGLGAFSRLGDVKAGDVITVTDAAGRQLSYRVVGKEAFDKKSVPLADLFSRSGAARLTLITCGGAFDSAALSYVDNIVVTAVPA